MNIFLSLDNSEWLMNYLNFEFRLVRTIGIELNALNVSNVCFFNFICKSKLKASLRLKYYIIFFLDFFEIIISLLSSINKYSSSLSSIIENIQNPNHPKFWMWIRIEIFVFFIVIIWNIWIAKKHTFNKYHLPIANTFSKLKQLYSVSQQNLHS